MRARGDRFLPVPSTLRTGGAAARTAVASLDSFLSAGVGSQARDVLKQATILHNKDRDGKEKEKSVVPEFHSALSSFSNAAKSVERGVFFARKQAQAAAEALGNDPSNLPK